jgi:hypothetical protein
MASTVSSSFFHRRWIYSEVSLRDANIAYFTSGLMYPNLTKGLICASNTSNTAFCNTLVYSFSFLFASLFLSDSVYVESVGLANIS